MTANTWPQPTVPGPPPMGWMTGSGNISYLNGQDPTAARAFFDNANSFCTGASLTASPVPGTYHTTPILSLASYTNAATDPSPGLDALLTAGDITYPYKWIMYDNEDWTSTPTAEQNNPPLYMQDFVNRCHAHVPRYNVCLAPGYDLFTTAKAMYPLNPGETQEQWFVRVIVGMGAINCDMFLLQNESQQNSGLYATLFNDTTNKVASVSVSPNALVFGEVSSQNATGSTAQALGTNMATNALTLTSPYPDGFYVAMPLATGESAGGPHQAAGRYFLDDMMAAGYSA